MTDLSEDQRDALGQLHGWMARRIDMAHRAGDRDRADYYDRWRRHVSGAIDPQGQAAPAPAEDGGDREAREHDRAELTRELHGALAERDHDRAARLDRERQALTAGLYGGGDIVGRNGRAL